ncbi:hypothetical protein ARMGADRAFT_1037030 [Armillaria gallica]|uniref:Uncharacterized protein n=1 Tax=Armillaria gallica TaxID=47427 RepID=A0A2H3CND8_ARMGA|nr:hypothetical protein ARMGADRAFT_1037030 [Armillaria gallica]
MWGVFEETSFFLSLCRHGLVLLGADMVKSGEQAKYLLAIVAKLLEVFGKHLSIGYDIGCKFGGLEDLKTLERFFSKSNALARGICYASHFHCHQRITWYLKHIDHLDSFKHLKLGMTDEKEFEAWLKEEEAYLSGLRCELLEETIEMEYYMRLVHYYDIEHLLKKRSQELEGVQDLERSLNISPEEHWTIGLEKWRENEQRVALRTYRQCLDQLEGLIVVRIFELTKMNISHTGYKMRKHIGKALKARLQAIQTALSHYNAAASALTLSRSPLQWEQVVKYAFLADFDLLCDVQQNMSEHKWATPAGHQAMDMYFKICQAKEEIMHLNIEIQQIYICVAKRERSLKHCT